MPAAKKTQLTTNTKSVCHHYNIAVAMVIPLLTNLASERFWKEITWGACPEPERAARRVPELPAPQIRS
jgi:hypothetical protein